MTSETPAHQCQPWQMRRRPEGGRYCAACGRMAVIEPPRGHLAAEAVAVCPGTCPGDESWCCLEVEG